MNITDLRVAIIGHSPVIRITTDEGIDGLGPVAIPRAGHIRWHVPFYKEHIIGEDPTDVERVMLKIRRMGAFKPWGSAVSGGRDYRLLFPDSDYWSVDESPGVGYYFVLASEKPFAF